MIIDHSTVTVLTALVRELSSELDFHFHDEDLHAARATIEVLNQAADLMTKAGLTVPEVYRHIVGRFDRVTRQ